MSKNEASESVASSRDSSPESGSQSTKLPNGSAKKSSKSTKPRLTASQKNFNHKDAENKRRTAIRERFTELSTLVPGALGQERSEQVMLGKTTEYLREVLQEQRRLERLADAQGIHIDPSKRLTDEDYGGSKWKEPNMDQYEAAKRKRAGTGGDDIKDEGEDD